MNTILQVPIDKNIRKKAALRAEKMGFSSLQEVVRIFLNKIASDQITVEFEPEVKLSAKNEKRYSKMIEDVESGRVKTKSFSNAESLMEYLNSEH